MSNEFILYDLPSRGTPKCWSLNPWKARLVLNYKNLPYKTTWLEYPDIAPTFKSFSIPPNDPSINPNADYSSPAIKLPSGHYIMDSLAIAHELERLYPSTPSLKLSGNDYAARVQTAVGKLAGALFPISIPRVMAEVLNPESQEYFGPTRQKRVGVRLEELAKSDRAGEAAWKEAEEGLRELKGLVVDENEGVFVQGGDDEPSFADFILAGAFRFLEILDHDGDLFGRVMKYDEGFVRHYEACKPWLQRDD